VRDSKCILKNVLLLLWQKYLLKPMPYSSSWTIKQKLQISVLNYLGKPRDCILQLDCPWCYDAANPGAHRRKPKSSGPESNTAFLGEFWYNGVSDYFNLIAAQRLQSCLEFIFFGRCSKFLPKNVLWATVPFLQHTFEKNAPRCRTPFYLRILLFDLIVARFCAGLKQG